MTLSNILFGTARKIISTFVLRLCSILIIVVLCIIFVSFFHSFIAVFLFSFVGNTMNFFIHSLNRFVLKKAPYALLSSSRCPFCYLYMQIYIACKLDWEENIFDWSVESVAFRIKIIMHNFSLIINHSCLPDSNMRIGTYLDQTQAIM